MLSEAAIWNQNSDSKPQLNIQYQSQTADSDSDEEPVSTKRTPAALKVSRSVRQFPNKNHP